LLNKQLLHAIEMQNCMPADLVGQNLTKSWMDAFRWNFLDRAAGT